ncbi:tetratricopeptide repeat protein [Catellatospora citrea]|uniref:tetratricopeptide repeat protein n=1 Tax=Catellatospora citrea TaxID=53366 RepID=UPI0033CA0C85
MHEDLLKSISRNTRIAVVMGLGALASGIAGLLNPWWFLSIPVSTIGAGLVTKGTLDQLERRSRTKSSAAASHPLARIWNIPQPCRSFTGREWDLKEIVKYYEDQSPCTIAIHGMGGVGKTQLTLRHAHLSRTEVEVGWFINAARREYLITGLTELLAHLGVASTDDGLDDAKTCLMHLGNVSGFILVYDDVHDPTTVEDLLPTIGSGVALITSRHADWRGSVQPHRVTPLDPASSTEFLARRAGQKDPPGAEQLAAQLGGLPLALEQAAAYCDSTGVDYVAYLSQLTTRLEELLKTKKPPNYPLPLFHTWSMSIKEARGQSADAVDLLYLLAHLASAPLPIDLLPEALRDPDSVDRVVSVLNDLSLIQTDHTSKTIQMHVMLQLVVTNEVSHSRRETALIKRTATLLEAAFPQPRWVGSQTHEWERCAKLRPHAETVLENCRRVNLRTRTVANLIYWLAYYLDDIGNFDNAEPLHGECIALRTELLGAEHPDTLNALNNLATVLRRTDRLEEAGELHQRILEVRQRTLGTQHPDTLVSMNNLGRVKFDLGDFDAARALLEQAVRDFPESHHGEPHQNTLAAQTNLALVLVQQGEVDRGLDIHQKVLAEKQALLGGKDPDTLRSAYLTACTLRTVGRADEARTLLSETLAEQSRLLGIQHPDTVRTQSELNSLDSAPAG